MYYIVLDESGAMHLVNQRYFIIGGYYTSSITYARQMQKRIEKEYLISKGLDPLTSSKEIKGSDFTNVERSKVLNEYFNDDQIHPIAIIVDKKHTGLKDKSENVAFCYFSNILYNSVLKHGRLKPEKCVSIHIDQRTMATNMKYDLPTTLEITTRGFFSNIDLKFKQLDSKKSPEGRMADIICNTLFRYYHDVNNSKKILRKYHSIESNVYLNFFPYKKFGE